MVVQAYFDFGNSRVKGWLCRDGQVVCRFGKPHALSIKRIEEELPDEFRQPIDVLGVASVLDDEFNERFGQLALQLWGCVPSYARSNTPNRHAVNGYHEPEMLGIDRWLNIVAVSDFQQVCVVSCGTALTIDLVAGGKHMGGYILPGYTLQLQSLTQGTKRVRAEEVVGVGSLAPGKDTNAAVNRGVIIGLIGAIERIVRDFERECGKPCRVILTGGDAPKLGPHMSVSHDIIPELILLGLQRYFI